MGFAKNKLRRAPKIGTGGLGPNLPVQWTLSRDAATADEGTNVGYAIAVNYRGRVPFPLSIDVTVPQNVDGISLTAGGADFDGSFFGAIGTAIAAAGGGATAIYNFEAFFVRITRPDWTVPFAINRLANNNPAMQGDKITGLQILNPTLGDLVVDAVSVTIVDLTSVVAVPANTTLPSLSDPSPAVDSAITLNPGNWTNLPEGYRLQMQKRISDVPPSFADNFDRTNQNLTASASWELMVGTAGNITVSSNGVATATGFGTQVAAKPSLGDVDHFVQAKIKNTGVGRGLLFLKYVDSLNFIYVRRTTSNYQVKVVVAGGSGGTGALRMSPAPAVITVNDVIRLECVANVLTFKNNGVTVGSTYTLDATEITALSAGTRAGIGSDSAGGGVVVFDDFSHGGFTAGSGVPSDIPNAIGPTQYVPVPADLNYELRLAAIAFNSGGDGVVAYSAYTAPVIQTPTPQQVPVIVAGAGNQPSISDLTPTQNQLLTANVGVWINNPDGFIIRWQEVTTDIPNYTNSSTYTAQSDVVGSTLRIGVIAYNEAGNSVEVFSAATATVAAAAGALTSVTISNDFILRGAANDTVVGILQGNVPIGTAVFENSTASEGGRFKIVESPAGTFTVKATTIPADFEGPVTKTGAAGQLGAGVQVTKGIPFYLPTFRCSGGGGPTFDTQIRIRAQFAAINPTGGGAASPSDVSTFAALRSIINGDGGVSSDPPPSSNNRVVRIDPAFTGTIEANSNNATRINCSNFTLLSHRQAIAIKDRPISIVGGNNIIIRGLASRPGADVVGEENRDGFYIADNIRNGLGQVSPYKASNVIFENCDFSWSWDEIFSIFISGGSGPFARSIRFKRCLFHDPLREAGNPKGAAHNFGALIYNNSMDIVFDKSVFIGNAQRSPMISSTRGALIQNCIMNYQTSGGGTGGTAFSNGAAAATNTENHTAILRGNLYWPHPGSARNRAITFLSVGTNSWINIPVTGEYVNHFYNPITENFNPDPVTSAYWNFDLTPGAGYTSSPACVVPWEPFKPADYGVMPTSHPTDVALGIARRQAMFEDVIYNVGVRTYDGGQRYGTTPDTGILAMSKIGATAIQLLLSDGTCKGARGAFPFGGYPPSNYKTVGGVTEPVLSNINIAYDTGVPT